MPCYTYGTEVDIYIVVESLFINLRMRLFSTDGKLFAIQLGE